MCIRDRRYTVLKNFTIDLPYATLSIMLVDKLSFVCETDAIIEFQNEVISVNDDPNLSSRVNRRQRLDNRCWFSHLNVYRKFHVDALRIYVHYW